MSVRVRFAPSPTGMLHIGGARTAIYNWAFARRVGGAFVLRIDDTDPERSTPENTAQILRSLRWLGLDWDEGPEVGGDFGPYFQTQRLSIYREALERLKATGGAYPCFCTPDELERKRALARSTGAVGYDRSCRGLAPVESDRRIEAGEPHVWRLAAPLERGEIVIDDAVRGRTAFPAHVMDDFVLVRSDGTPTYNFATVVDDATMRITHVIRGDDHLANTPRQVLVYEALGYPVPRFAHLSIILGVDGKKLSKRHGAASVEAFRDEGILPDALVNYLALLGWSLDGETTVIPRTTLVSAFSLDRVSKNPAIFDPDKLRWLNGVYLRALDPDRFIDAAAPWLVAAGLVTEHEIEERRAWFRRLVPLVNERVTTLSELPDKVSFFFTEPAIEPGKASELLATQDAARALEAARRALEAIQFDEAAIEAALRGAAEAAGIRPKVLFQSVRAAVTGSTVSPPLFETLALLGKERALQRIEAALSRSR